MNSRFEKEIEELYIQMFDCLFCYALASLDNPGMAEEAVQETFHIACRKVDNLLSSPSPKGWLMNTLKNVIRNTKRKQDSAYHLLMAYIASHIGSVQDHGLESQHLDLWYNDISQTEDFQLLKERVIEKRSYLEMASDRGIKVATCRKRVQRAKESLREKIKL